jgi:hypothetical protein
MPDTVEKGNAIGSSYEIGAEKHFVMEAIFQPHLMGENVNFYLKLLTL